MSLFSMFVAQQVSDYLAIIRCIKIIGEMGAFLYAFITHVDTFSKYYDLILKSEVRIISFMQQHLL
jgi:hypothetical protein